MRLLALVVVAVIGLAVTACQNPEMTPEQQQEQQRITACDGLSAALETLAVYRAQGKLSQTQVDLVQGVKNTVDPPSESNPLGKGYCEEEAPTIELGMTVLEIVEAIRLQALQLALIKGETEV